MSFQDNYQWQRRFLPDLKAIAAQVLIREAPQEEDCQRNTDLIVLRLEPLRVACRVRRHSYYDRFSDEFTLRAKLPSGMDTELAKVLAGWGDYIIYGFSDEKEEHLCAYILGDLSKFRLWFNRFLVQHKGQLPGLEKENGDGSSVFRVFSLSELPPDFVVDRSPVANCLRTNLLVA